MIEPHKGRVYDPCCGSGGMFAQSERFVEVHGGGRSDIAVYGGESNDTTWRLPKMNLAIRGIEANLGPKWGHLPRRLAPGPEGRSHSRNLRFNVSHWGGHAHAGSKGLRGTLFDSGPDYQQPSAVAFHGFTRSPPITPLD